jgi:RNA polymerase sigma-70 factor (ECF subfamily)
VDQPSSSDRVQPGRQGERVEWECSTEALPSDADLVRRTCAGQRRAFDELIERYQRRAISVAYRLLGDLHDALEVCQEAFVRAYQNLDSLQDRRRFGSWLLRIVTNLSLNFRRSRAAIARKAAFDDCLNDGDCAREEQVAAPSYSEEQPGARSAAAEMSVLVQKAIADLPDQQKTALVLFSIEQLPQKEVASIMGCSVEAVKWHVFQARRKMKEALAPYL